MNVSKTGLDLIKSFEGVRLKSYKCLKTEKLWTIGYGHYGVADGLTITEKEAEEFLVKDLATAESNVNKFNSKYSFTQNQYDALVSFAFNVGSINQLTNNGKRSVDEIGAAITLYNKSSGKIIKGLVRRRKAEYELFTKREVPQIKTTSQLAEEVISGIWGDGIDRKNNLANAGYNYKEVQKCVNELLKEE